ncbi:MAG: hypothetical protein WA865_21425, partial [Spirulinaceae cyanobacterium]
FPLTLTLGLSTVSCTESPLGQSTEPSTPVQAEAKPQAQTVSSTSVTPAPKTNQRNYFQEALNSGRQAANGASSANSAKDWQQVAQNWQQGIKHLQTVSRTSSNYNKAQNKIYEYENNLATAKYQQQQYLYQENPCLLVAEEANSSQLVELNKVDFYPTSSGQSNYITGCITNHSGKTLSNVRVSYNYAGLNPAAGIIFGQKNSSLAFTNTTVKPGQTVPFQLNSSLDGDILYVEITSLSSELGTIPLYVEVGG